jgi:hypothetical protein
MRKAHHGTKALSLFFLSFGLSPLASATVGHPRTHRDCRVLRSKRVPIVLRDGRQVYVEPNAIVQSGKRILVAGFPSYVWGAKGNSQVDLRNTLFGIVISPDGSADFIPSPLPAGHLSDVRALALPNGNWAATFADVAPETQFNPKISPRVEGYWFGITDGKTWVVERVPTTPGEIQPTFASRLLHSGAGYSVAMPVDLGHNADGLAHTAAAVFTRGEDGWTRRDRVFEFVSYVSLDTTSSGNLMLGAIAVDTTDRHVRNRLAFYRFYNVDSTWHEFTRLEGDTSRRMHHPDVVWYGDSLTVTWLETNNGSTRMEAKAAVGVTQSSRPRIQTISRDAIQTIPLRNAARPSWLALQQVDSVSKRIVFVQSTGANSASQFAVDVPFSGFIGAVVSSAKLLIIGPVSPNDGKAPVVSSHLLTIELSCSLGS